MLDLVIDLEAYESYIVYFIISIYNFYRRLSKTCKEQIPIACADTFTVLKRAREVTMPPPPLYDTESIKSIYTCI